MIYIVALGGGFKCPRKILVKIGPPVPLAPNLEFFLIICDLFFYRVNPSIFLLSFVTEKIEMAMATQFNKFDHVLIGGLKVAKELNGKKGQIVTFVEFLIGGLKVPGYYVYVPDIRGHRCIKAENLQACGPPEVKNKCFQLSITLKYKFCNK